MKKRTLFIIATGFIFLSSCNKDEDTKNALSKDEAANIISTAVCKNSIGITSSMEGSVEVVNAFSNGYLTPTSKRKASGTLINTYAVDTTFENPPIYSNTIHYDYSILIDEDLNPYIPVTYTSEGYFEGNRISSTHTGSGEYTLTKFYNSNTCTLNGTFNRASNQQSKVFQKRQSNCNTVLVCKDIILSTNTHLIQSGTIDVSIEGFVTGIGLFQYTGVITFKGNNTADMLIGDKAYSLNLETGVFAEK